MLRANPIARTASPIAMIVHTPIRLLRPDLTNLRSSALRFLLVLIAVITGCEPYMPALTSARAACSSPCTR